MFPHWQWRQRFANPVNIKKLLICRWNSSMKFPTESKEIKFRLCRTYNVTAMSFTPEELVNKIWEIQPDALINYNIDPIRQLIAESWPRSLDDSKARADWQWSHDYNLEQTVKIMYDLISKQNENETRRPAPWNNPENKWILILFKYCMRTEFEEISSSITIPCHLYCLTPLKLINKKIVIY